MAEANREQATESVIGVSEIATQAETDAGSDDSRVVTPLKLATTPRLPSQAQKDALAGTTGSPSSTNKYVTDTDSRLAQATDTSRGTTELATVAEAEAKSSSTVAVTPAGLASFPMKKTGIVTGDAIVTSFTITHNLNTKNIVVNIFDDATPFAQPTVTIKHDTVNAIKVEFGTAPASGKTYTVIIIG